MLFVTNLTRNVTQEHLQEIFGKYGKIKTVDVFVEKRTNLPKGKALINFENRPSAEAAQTFMNGVGNAKKFVCFTNMF